LEHSCKLMNDEGANVQQFQNGFFRERKELRDYENQSKYWGLYITSTQFRSGISWKLLREYKSQCGKQSNFSN
ncbi:MAG: hypothetical protein ACE5NG_15605, partial [bacterium]